MKNVGVSMLEFEATYSTEKSFDNRPIIITTFATTTSANSEYAEVRALSIRPGLWVRAPTTETTAP